MTQQQPQHSSPGGHPSTAQPANAAPAAARRQHLPQVLVARMLTMTLQNGIAILTQRARPHSLAALNAVRMELLQHCPFFDPTHKPEELGQRTRRAPLSFVDTVVLLARLMKVLTRHGNLTETEITERVEVRNECLDLPFFDRALAGSNRPFVRDDFTDEGCVV